MTCVICSDKYTVLFNNTLVGLQLFTEDSFLACEHTHIVWDARGSLKKEKIKEDLESCCLLRSIEIIDSSDDLLSWLEEVYRDKYVFHFIGDYPVSYPECISVESNAQGSFPIVLSNVCWDPKDDERMWEWLRDKNVKLNIALSMYDKVDVHFVKRLGQKIKENELEVFSMNSLFYNKSDNIFVDTNKFHVHFRLALEYGKFLGISSIIYGSSNSKYVRTDRTAEYVNYQIANDTFANTFYQLAEYAKSLGVKIYIKPNKNACNFMFDDDHLEQMVCAIDHEACCQGTARSDNITFFNDFYMIEFPRSMFVDVSSLQIYLDSLFRFLGSL